MHEVRVKKNTMNTRKNDIRDRLRDVVFRQEARLNSPVLQQLPSYHFVYNEILIPLSEKLLRLPWWTTYVINELAEELRDIWIYMNIQGICRKIL